MPRRWTSIAVAAAVLCALAVPSWKADALQDVRQILPQPYHDEPYVNELLRMFEEWNTKRFPALERAKLREPFEQRLKTVLGRRKYSYQNEGWARDMRDRFEKMPIVVKPELPITPTSQATLTALYLKDVAIVRSVPVPKARDELTLSLFLILGKAQEDARKAGRPALESLLVLQGLFFWWTVSWPFCD